ncbi:glycoside hydrolase family 13 protein [Baudoinia panamericana UAMH 10762]|uniref:Glycoside hydrolase family 13 protein n=1 Tax=Baudoinia panamericana (strain UAMH 10762) TaxID=717646 RepID=M2MXN7_BAUPA|nr:glycoside hydrolase family 13 protein [Baudoinia panamericana UAMH 10762]EMC91434.1 glycoside hydrolase family 13 protein [Baudoinia panamericana UAMH 10762]
MVFWLEKGVDGFRVDTVNMYSKDPAFPDAPVTDLNAECQEAGLTYCNGPRMNEYLAEMHAILSRYDAVTVGECPFTPDIDTVVGYVSAAQKRLNMVFQFDAVDIGKGKVFQYQTTPFNYTLSDLRNAISQTQGLLRYPDAWTTSFIENHDQARSISRFGDDSPRWRVRSGKILAMLFACLSGTLFIYQGQEIGMINMPKDWPIEEYLDVDSSNYYRMVAQRSKNDPAELANAHAALQHLSRDHARTPMQWNAAVNGGFTSPDTKPWMRVNSSATSINVAKQVKDRDSILAFWKHMLQMRKTYSNLLVHGELELLDQDNGSVFSFVKQGTRGQRALVTCNFAGEHSKAPGVLKHNQRKLLLSNVGSIGESCEVHPDVLEPWEGRLYLLN